MAAAYLHFQSVCEQDLDNLLVKSRVILKQFDYLVLDFCVWELAQQWEQIIYLIYLIK